MRFTGSPCVRKRGGIQTILVHFWRHVGASGTKSERMFSRASKVLLLCGLLCAVGVGYDGGDYWFAVHEGIESVALSALAMDPNEPAVLYVTGPEGTYKTTSGGESLKDETRVLGSTRAGDAQSTGNR